MTVKKSLRIKNKISFLKIRTSEIIVILLQVNEKFLIQASIFFYCPYSCYNYNLISKYQTVISSLVSDEFQHFSNSTQSNEGTEVKKNSEELNTQFFSNSPHDPFSTNLLYGSEVWIEPPGPFCGASVSHPEQSVGIVSGNVL